MTFEALIRPLARYRFDLLLAAILLFAAHVLVLRTPPLTSLAIVPCYLLFFLSSAASPDLSGRGRSQLLDPPASGGAPFFLALGGNGTVFSALVLLFLSGIAVLMWELPLAFSTWCFLLHFFVGLSVIYVSLTSLAIRVFRARANPLDLLLDFFAAAALFVLLLLCLEFLLPDPSFFLYTLLALGVCGLLTWRRRTFEDIRAWVVSLLQTLACIPYALLVLYLFAYVPFRVHLTNPYTYEYHVSLGKLATVLLLAPQLLLVAARVRRAAPGQRRQVFRLLARRLLLALLIPVLLLSVLFLLSRLGLDPKPLQEILLPIPRG